MSKIFQQSPTRVIVHHLPKDAMYFTYRFDDLLNISAWMPENRYHIEQKTHETDDDFYYRYCEECERNCSDFLNEYENDDGEIDWDEIPGGENGHCYVYDNGYDGQHCPRGFVHEHSEFVFDVSHMVFEVKLNSRTYYKTSDTAFLCGSRVVNSKFENTETRLAANVFGSDTYPGHICWGGGNSPPETLREIEVQFFSTKFNSDLLPLNQFPENVKRIQSFIDEGRFSSNSNYHLLYDNRNSDNGPMDSLIIVDAELHIPAFFSLLTAGFKPLELKPHMMLIPAKETEIVKNGMTFRGYETIPDSLGKSWFISLEDKYLVGQI